MSTCDVYNNHSETSNPFHYQDVIARRINNKDVQARLTVTQLFRNETLFKVVYYIDRYIFISAIYQDPGFFNSKKVSSNRLANFQKNVYALSEEIYTLSRKVFDAYESVADVHIQNHFMRKILEDVILQESPQDMPAFEEQREELIQKGVLPSSPALKPEEIVKFKNILNTKNEAEKQNKMHVYLTSILHTLRGNIKMTDVDKFDRKLAKTTQKVCDRYSMSLQELGQAINKLPHDFNKICGRKVDLVLADSK